MASRRFRGESHHKIDGKGRVSIPAAFRRVLEAGDPDWTEGLNPTLVIVYGDHRRKFLECYTIAAMDEVDAKIAALPRGSQRRRILEDLFQSKSQTTSVDETGRLVLSAKLRDRIGLTTEALFRGTGDTFQIWKPEVHVETEEERIEAWLDNQPEEFDPLVLLDSEVEV